VRDVPHHLEHRRVTNALDDAALLARVQVLLLAHVDVSDRPIDDVEDARGEAVGVGQDHVLVDLRVEEDVGVGALPGVDDLVVVAGDELALHVGFPLLVHLVLEGGDVLKLVDDEVVDVGDERALRDAFEHVGEADEAVFTLVRPPRADDFGHVDPFVVGRPRRRVLVPLLCVRVVVGRETHRLHVPLEGHLVPVGHVALGALQPLAGGDDLVAERRRPGGSAAGAAVLVLVLDAVLLAELLLVALADHVATREVEQFVRLRVHRADVALERPGRHVESLGEAFPHLCGRGARVGDHEHVADAHVVVLQELVYAVEEGRRLPATRATEEASDRSVVAHYPATRPAAV
jgi:hypothetical protein